MRQHAGSALLPVAPLPVTLVAVALVALLLLPSPTRAAEVAQLGSIDFPNSGAADAQDAFVRGVLLLHSFEYADAREAFQQAQAIDPDFALAHWGEAMTHNHPLWNQVDREAAWAALAELAPTAQERLAKAPTERERAYLTAVETLYGTADDGTTKAERDAAYEQAMEGLAARWPDDLEAQTFHALSILGTAQGVRDHRAYMRAAAEAEEVFAANPRHPGAVHYLIHSYDDPIHAPLGLRAARVYAGIAPAASHAQHMISHIYVALGRWRDSLRANETAFAVSRERRRRKALGVDALDLHSYQWLHYTYLQLGQLKRARQMLTRMADYAAEGDSSRTAWYHAALRAAWVAETGDAEPPTGPDLADLRFSGRARQLFADGYAAWRGGEMQSTAAAHTRLAELVDLARPEDEAPDQDVLQAAILADELAALVELEAGRTPAALELLDRATAAEAALPLGYGPPDVVKPSHELYGEVLLRLGLPAEARGRFEEALQRAPRRRLSLTGLARAADALGDAETAGRACAELAAILTGADEGVTVPGVCAEEQSADRSLKNVNDIG